MNLYLLTFNWQSIDIQLAVNLYGIQLTVNWLSIDSQFVLDWNKFISAYGSSGVSLYRGKRPRSRRLRWIFTNWHSIGSQLTFNWLSICIGFNWQSIDIQLAVNLYWIGMNSSQPLAPRLFPSIEGNDRGAIGWDESLLIDIQLAVKWHSIGCQFVWDSIGIQLTFNWQSICIGLEWIHLSLWLLGCFPL